MESLSLVKNWFKELLFPSTYCESLSRSNGLSKASNANILKIKKNNILSLQLYDTDLFHKGIYFSKLNYSFHSPSLFVETQIIKTRQLSRMDATVSRHIKKLDIFEDRFNYCYDLISFDGKTANVNIFALAADEASKILNKIPHNEKLVDNVVPLEYVILKLLDNTTNNTVVSVWIEHQDILILVTKGKEILSRSVFEYVDNKNESEAKDITEKEIVQWLINNKHIQNTLETVKRQDPEQDISLLAWGKSYQFLQETLEQYLKLKIDKNLAIIINNKFVWKTHLDSQSQSKNKGISTNKNQKNTVQFYSDDIDAIFKNPSLFGLAICKKSQSFISPDYELTYSKFKHSHYALIASIVFFLGFSLFNLNTYFNQTTNEDKLFQEFSLLDSGIKQIKPRIPAKAKLASVLEKTKFKIAIDTELNINKFLGWMTNITPEKAFIDQLTIKSSPVLKPVTKARSKKTNNIIEVAKKYTVELRIILNRAFFESVTHSDLFFEKLNERVSSPKSKFIYVKESDEIPSALLLTFAVNPAKFY